MTGQWCGLARLRGEITGRAQLALGARMQTGRTSYLRIVLWEADRETRAEPEA